MVMLCDEGKFAAVTVDAATPSRRPEAPATKPAKPKVAARVAKAPMVKPRAWLSLSRRARTRRPSPLRLTLWTASASTRYTTTLKTNFAWEVRSANPATLTSSSDRPNPAIHVCPSSHSRATTANANVVTAANRPRSRSPGSPISKVVSDPAIPAATSPRSRSPVDDAMRIPITAPTPATANCPSDSCPAMPVMTKTERAIDAVATTKVSETAVALEPSAPAPTRTAPTSAARAAPTRRARGGSGALAIDIQLLVSVEREPVWRCTRRPAKTTTNMASATAPPESTLKLTISWKTPSAMPAANATPSDRKRAMTAAAIAGTSSVGPAEEAAAEPNAPVTRIDDSPESAPANPHATAEARAGLRPARRAASGLAAAPRIVRPICVRRRMSETESTASGPRKRIAVNAGFIVSESRCHSGKPGGNGIVDVAAPRMAATRKSRNCDSPSVATTVITRGADRRRLITTSSQSAAIVAAVPNAAGKVIQ